MGFLVYRFKHIFRRSPAAPVPRLLPTHTTLRADRLVYNITRNTGALGCTTTELVELTGLARRTVSGALMSLEKRKLLYKREAKVRRNTSRKAVFVYVAYENTTEFHYGV